MIAVLEPGPLTSVQTPGGRPGWRHAGVPVGGAADEWSARLANRLVGNEDDAALIEVTLGGAAFRLEVAAVVAVTGGLDASVGGVPLPGSAGTAVRGGAVVRMAPGPGARGYLAVGGGIDVERVLGSAATDLRSRFGGHEGRALRPGDRLALARGTAAPRRWSGVRDAGAIRIVAGPHGDGLEGEWTVGIEADRTGVRLDGRPLNGGEVASMGLPVGAVQVPPDGRPIVMLADRPVTGGYRVPACVIRADVGRVAQLRTDDRVTLVSVSMADARAALSRSEAQLAALEPLTVGGDDEIGWAGAPG